MVLETKTGTFTKDSTGTDGATNVISTSFQPKAIIIWGVLQQVADSENGGNASHSQGFSDGVNSRCVDVRSEDNVARSDYLRTQNNDGVLGFLDPAGLGFLAKASVVFNATDFTVTWDINNTDASRIHYIIYGGSDITGVQVSDFVKTTAAAPVNQSIEGLDADVQNATPGEAIVFFLHARRNAFNITTNDIFTQLGAASDTTEEAVFAAGGDDNDAVGQPFLFNLDDACIIGTGTASGGINYEGEFNGFDALGFDINFRVNDGVTDIISFMIIKGGKWEVGTETAGTVTGNKVTTTGHQPKGLLVIGNKQTVTGFSQGIDQSYNIGASDAITETSGAWTDQDGAIDMIVGSSSSITKLARILNALGTPTVNGEANVASFNPTNFTLDWTNAASAAFRFMWVIAGDGAAAGLIQIANEVLDHSETAISKVELRRIADEILEHVEGALPVLALVRIGSDILDHIETAISKVEIRKIADEILDHIETPVKVLGIVQIGSDILEHFESAISIKGIVKIGSDILDHVELALRLLALVRIGSDILDHVESAISHIELRKIADEVLEHVETALAILPVALIKIADEVLEHVESAIKVIVQKGIGIFGRRSLDKIRSMDKG